MILLQPHPAKTLNGLDNAKAYPYWKELLKLYSDTIDEEIIQIGIEGEEQLVDNFKVDLSLDEINKLVVQCHYWISVDSFLQHLAYHHYKPGVVIWSVSDPNIFGYPCNLNLLKDRKYLRKNQFNNWNLQSYVKEAFMQPVEIISLVYDRFHKR